MLRDFLCVVGAAEEGSASLAQGVALGSGYGIAPDYVAVVPGPPPLSNIFGADLVDSLVREAKVRAAESADQVSERIVALARRNGQEANVLKETRSLAEAVARIERLARCHDLTVMERPDSFTSTMAAVFEAVLFETGRPVLLAVPGQAPERFRRALLAWDGSVHATRALAAIVSLFPDLAEVFVLTVLREKNLDDAVPAAEIAAHIRRHGIQASATCIDLDPFGKNAGPAIADFAKSKSVDLLAMGGYGHSRLREFLLGGVTEYLSRHANVPLLLVH